jgi:hypothetical protein
MSEREKKGTCPHCHHPGGTHSITCVMVVDDNRTKTVLVGGVLTEEKPKKGVFNQKSW